jgi:tripartite ATP-independent transporter DctM subunit
MLVILFAGGFLFLVFLSVPIAFSLGLSTTLVLFLTDSPIGIMPQRLWNGLDKFAFVAIPFFILAGELMNSSGIVARLVDFARLLVGNMKGGLLHINIVASMIFGGINGSAVADASAVGGMLIPPTIREYKDADLAAAVTACASVCGPIIPPSLPMLIYALAAGNVSVGALFLSGIVPGVLLGFGLMMGTYFIVRNRNYPKDKNKYSIKEITSIVKRFSVAVLMPVIMVGGIVSGFCSPTESGVLAVIYALVIGFFVTKDLTIKNVYQAFTRTTVVTSVVFLIIAVSNVSTWWLSTQHFPLIVANFFRDISSNVNIFLLLVVILYLIIGIFLEAAAAMIMLVPVLVPIAMSYGIHPIHFGLVTCLGLLIGLLTPPVALSLFITSSIANRPIMSVFKAALPLILVEIVVLFIITYLPMSFLWIPFLFGYK